MPCPRHIAIVINAIICGGITIQGGRTWISGMGGIGGIGGISGTCTVTVPCSERSWPPPFRQAGGFVALRQQSLGEIEPLLEFGDAVLQHVGVGELLLQFVHPLFQRRVAAPRPSMRAAKARTSGTSSL